MKNNMDELLKRVLTPNEEPGDDLNRRILDQVKENDGMKNKKYRRASAAVVAAALVAASSLTAFAAWQYRSASDVADAIGDESLSRAFAEQEGSEYGNSDTGSTKTDMNQVQSCGGYEVTMLGLVSGDGLSEYQSKVNGEIRSDRTYIAVAIRKEDGTDIDGERDEFFVSPLIGSLNPGLYNAVTLSGSYGQYVEDGVLYRLLECDNIECFADQNLYLCVTDSTFFHNALYNWDESQGCITRNEAYEGLNALFDLHLDASKADPDKAQALIEEIDKGGSASGEESEIDIPKEAAEAMEWAEKLTPENIDQYCVRMENTVETVVPDENGWISFSPWLVNEAVSDSAGGGGARGYLKYFFEDGYQGLKIDGYSCSENGMKDLVITTYTMNDDGTVTFAAYVPKEVSMYLQ